MQLFQLKPSPAAQAAPQTSVTPEANTPIEHVVQTDFRLTWQEGLLKEHIKRVQINRDLQGWMKKDPGIHNWVWTTVSVFAMMRDLGVDVPVPDQFAGPMNLYTLHLIRLDDGLIHVMV